MTSDSLKSFLDAVDTNKGLQDKVKSAKDSEALIAIAKDAGFTISIQDINSAKSEVSEAELEGVAGGMIMSNLTCHGGILCDG